MISDRFTSRALSSGANPQAPLSVDGDPKLTPERHIALHKVQEAAEKVSLRIAPQAANLLFLNNCALLHARSAFVDSPTDVWKQRYIMRLWLHDLHKGWKSAEILQRKLDETFDLGPEHQGLYTGNEWNSLPRGMRVKEMGVTGNDCHD